jgi:hypothetical protein
MQAHGKGLAPLMGIDRRQIFAVRLGGHTANLCRVQVLGAQQKGSMPCAFF